MYKELPDFILTLLKDRGYFHEGETTWEDLSLRVAKALASCEKESVRQKWQDEFYRLLSTRRFVNSTPTLMNADEKDMGGLSSCFIIDVKDDLMAIHEAIGKCAKIYQYNGGVGFDISPLRPAMAPLGTAHGSAGGPVAFMEEFNAAAKAATLYNHRKSATKIDMQVWHPDIQAFIHCKDDGVSLTLMNISVSIPDRFMEAVEKDESWDLVFPDYEHMNKAVYNAEWDGDLEKWRSKGYPVKVYKTLRARDLMREIAESAWRRGDPGVNFYDHMNLKNPNKHIGRVSGTNPCAEFNSLPYTSCCLGSFNLMAYVNENDNFDFDALESDVPVALRMLDNVITLNRYPLPEIERMTKANRSVGIGIMGFADLMYRLKIPYYEVDASGCLNDILTTIQNAAVEASRALAEERDVYPNYFGSAYDKDRDPVRNSDFTSIAPTGSISTICGVSSSIEPNFGLVYERHTADGRTFYIVNPEFEAWLKANDLYSDELLKAISQDHGSCQRIAAIPDEMKRVFVTAHDLTPDEHIVMTAEAQDVISLSVSKTVNLPHEAKVEDVEATYRKAYESGLLGVTVYRDGCRVDQVLTTGSSYADASGQPSPSQPSSGQPSSAETPTEAKASSPLWGQVMAVNDHVVGFKRKLHTGCGTLHVQAFFDLDTGRMVEVFADRGGSGGCTALLSTVSRLISRALRLGDSVDNLCGQLQRTLPCYTYGRAKGSGKDVSPGFSCASAIAFAMKDMQAQVDGMTLVELDESEKSYEPLSASPPPDASVMGACPECGSTLTPDGGCAVCPACGYSKCA